MIAIFSLKHQLLELIKSIFIKVGKIYYYFNMDMLAYAFIFLGIIFLALYLKSYLSPKPGPENQAKTQKKQQKIIQRVSYGRVRIFYASQTGTAATLSNQLNDQGTEQGFQPQVYDIKDLDISHFETINEINIFLMSNSGEGDPPTNCIKWMNVLRGKQEMDQVKVVPWSQINYTVFGLGNTQYQNYNITGITADQLMDKNGAKRIYKLGLGDDNFSLQDDFTDWRKDLWGVLKEFRINNPLKEIQKESPIHRKESRDMNIRYISNAEPHYANFKLFLKTGNEEDYEWKEEDLDFKTKLSLKAQTSKINNIRELRQNCNDGSTLQIEVELQNQPDYQTADNIALYGKNDAVIVKEILDYFKIKENDLDTKIGLSQINPEKKLKINFIPNTLRTLLEQSIDTQGKLSKSVLKKLAKFQSNNPNYFTQNSLKTTDEFKRITQSADEGQWYNLIRIIAQHKVIMTFEDFIQLSDSMAPRLFTIASSFKHQKNVIVAASIIKNGLISKYFLSKPAFFKAQLKKSTFSDAMKWKKVIFIAAGTGFAPFRGYLQEKTYNITQKQEGKDCNVPIVTLFFGCKHQHGDFIYKDEIMEWKNTGVIDRLHLAFSRDSEKKLYVQDLLKRQQEELAELGHCEETAIYMCGSLPMGQSIINVLTESFGAEKVKAMQQKGRIVKQLW